ncbi:M48 family metallopeptidase [Magnetospirillum sp. UT-4]|uniref:M48 family metallopeptidase n=1 Tax=Magnetospirillum sp. UT-4 TaxID=2681467 RepID=UPI001382A8C0|nr:M48 family metallopeptidase [Magnetospirillum sp. UT-4]CAA7612872.1 Peptidase M48 Ste24p [Magnetospirillum sp. UT-4]
MPTVEARERRPGFGCCSGMRIPLVLAVSLALSACQPNSTGLGLDLVSARQAEQMGEQAWREMRAETPLTANAAWRERARAVADRVLRAAGQQPSAWEVAVFRKDDANAFALPARKIGIHEGMMRLAATDAELAAVIGHEVGHVLEGHAAERISTAMATEAGVGIAGAALGAAGVGGSGTIAQVLGLGAEYGIMLPYSRNQELEADRVGLELMARAGYDPRQAVALWRKMNEAGGDRPPTFLSTHPAPDERITRIEAMLPEVMPVWRKAG